ncbi:MAG TPA: HAMP domain-containing sensor histidine kinase [Catalimonadaceae bacterium]|nr:HAMP domain-containing sensor histidine kinase [Catalimonadaceae bacterium]
MKLNQKIQLLFSISFLICLGVSFVAVFLLYSAYRKQEFFQRLNDKAHTTLKILVEVEQIDHDLLQVFDRNTINSLYEEKILIFDSTGKPIYSSLDDTRVLFPEKVINELKAGKSEIKYTDGDFEVYACRMVDKNVTYYSIAKAKDKYGRNKLNFLGYSLTIGFVIAVGGIFVLTRYLSRQVTTPISNLSKEISRISSDDLSKRVSVSGSKDEISLLAIRFNELLNRLENSFVYQKNFIHHVSHELKTPIAVLISNLEKVAESKNEDVLKQGFEFQKAGLMQLAEVINTLLQLSKYESKTFSTLFSEIRIDEILFECFEDLKKLFPKANFDLQISEEITEERFLTVLGDAQMLKIAFTNLLRNAIHYSDNHSATLNLSTNGMELCIHIQNNGQTLQLSDQEKLFTHFFRGENSRNKKGVGLGLVMVGKILKLHSGEIEYSISAEGKNQFVIQLLIVKRTDIQKVQKS